MDPDDDAGLLWHYTDAEGLMGILRDEAIRASDCSLLNDANELREGFNVAAELCSRAIDGKETDLGVAELYDLANLLRAGYWATINIVFVASLSRRGNLLSQWRGYCPPSGGYAIGFDPGVLGEIAKARRFQLVECIYSAERQREAVREVLSPLTLFEAAAASGRTAAVWKQLRSAKREQVVQRRMLATAARIKNMGFVEEHESRLIWANPIVAETLHFRTNRSRGGVLIPYLKFSWAKGEGQPPVRAIRVGPMQHQEAAEVRLRHFLGSIGMAGNGISVSRSSIPFRA